MGIKSTTTLKRSQALAMYFELLEKLKGGRLPNNRELGDILDELHDEVLEREGRTSFDNFLVVDDDEPTDR